MFQFLVEDWEWSNKVRDEGIGNFRIVEVMRQRRHVCKLGRVKSVVSTY